MLAVNHQVAVGEVGVGAQLFPVGGGLGALFLRRGGLALSEDGHLDGGQLYAGGEAAAADHRLARLGKGGELEIHRRAHLLLPKEGLEIEAALLRARQNHHGEAGGEVVGEVGDGGLQADAVGGQLLGSDSQQRAGTGGVLGGGEGIQVGHRPLRELGGELLTLGGELIPLGLHALKLALRLLKGGHLPAVLCPTGQDIRRRLGLITLHKRGKPFFLSPAHEEHGQGHDGPAQNSAQDEHGQGIGAALGGAAERKAQNAAYRRAQKGQEGSPLLLQGHGLVVVGLGLGSGLGGVPAGETGV